MRFTWIDIILILFGLFLAYQIFLKIIGGSWQTEAIMIALLIFNLGLTWKITLDFSNHINWHKLREGK